MMKSSLCISVLRKWSKDWGNNQTKCYKLICKFVGVIRCGGNCIHKWREKKCLLESSYQDGHTHNKSRWQNVNPNACCCSRFRRCRWCSSDVAGLRLTSRCVCGGAWRSSNNRSSGAAINNHHGQKAHGNQKYWALHSWFPLLIWDNLRPRSVTFCKSSTVQIRQTAVNERNCR